MNEDHPLYKWHISIGFFYDAVRRGNCFSIEICLFNFGYLINYWVVLKYVDTSLCIYIYIQIHLSISTKIEFAAYHGSACRRPLQKPLQNNLEWRVRAPTLPLRCSSRHTLQNQMNPNPKLEKCPTCLLQSSARQQKLGPHTACLLPQSIVLETRVKTDTCAQRILWILLKHRTTTSSRCCLRLAFLRQPLRTWKPSQLFLESSEHFFGTDQLEY